jgi:hypothetical protein
MQITKILLALLLFCSACSSKDKDLDKSPKPDIKFDKAKWNANDGGTYTYRRQMVNDLVNNYKWGAVTKDSLLHMLGEPDDIEGDLFYIYYYEKEPMAAGIMSSHKGVTFELIPGGTKVKNAKLSKGAEWGN